jgi:RimJ/RimL family protein N-acetyltransferase
VIAVRKTRSVLRPTTDGVVTIRPPQPGDATTLIAGRDRVFHRFLGEGSADPNPVGCVVVDRRVVGWVDYDRDRSWLERGEVNVGYNVFAPHRGRGYATRAVHLLLHHMAVDTDVEVATLLIDRANERSQALARRVGCDAVADLDDHPYFKRQVPPLVYGDGVVTIRRLQSDDVDADLSAKDDEQIDWLWEPGQRESWEAMPPAQQRAHTLAGLQERHDTFGSGPKWTFAVDAADDRYVAYVDCDLHHDDVPAGEANIAYAAHPQHRGRGYVGRAVRLVLRFLHDHTGASEAHLIVDAENRASLRVAATVGAEVAGSWTDERGRAMVRHVVYVRS